MFVLLILAVAVVLILLAATAHGGDSRATSRRIARRALQRSPAVTGSIRRVVVFDVATRRLTGRAIISPA
jgi:hypothetical protein